MFANILFDAILIGILCVGVASGIKHGFVGTVAKPIKLLAAFSLAVSMAPTVGSSIIEPIIGPIITREISEVIREKYYSVNTSVTVGSLPTIIRILSVVSGVEIDSVPSGTESSSVIDNVVDTLTSPLVNVIGTVLGFIAVYFISKIFFKLFISFFLFYHFHFVNNQNTSSTNQYQLFTPKQIIVIQMELSEEQKEQKIENQRKRIRQDEPNYGCKRQASRKN